uniref:Wsv343-like protein n=1 Tax=Metapenaeus ensis nimavirus TaxID=2133794 RepID=A0A401IP87_9VIRU|nr:wsv343-like protein [Metapenaeus ensis nimavirus]
MFQADVLNMGGGKESDIDIRERLLLCAKEMARCPASINLSTSPKMKIYGNHKVPLEAPFDKNGTLTLNGQIDNLEPYSTHRLIDKKSPLVKSLGHCNVKDMGSDGSLNKSNLLYSGAFIVEYDLVETDKNGKRFMYSEPSALEMIVKRSTDAADDDKVPFHNSGCLFLDEIIASSHKTIKWLTKSEGHYVSSGKLLEDIIQLMRLYEEETKCFEATCMDPCIRKVLTTLCCDNNSGVLMPPMFGVAFLTNAALVGLKVVFFPTALTWTNFGLVKDSQKLKHLLKMQLDILAERMPKIVFAVERAKRKLALNLDIDIGGSANWNLPGHTKTSAMSFPYHHARFKDPERHVLEISNELMVTSLGVIKSEEAQKWMYNHLEEFMRRSSFITPFYDVFSEWRSKFLFSDVGPELPFRNKSISMDLDFCLSGMCYHYLASGQGILLSKRPQSSGYHSGDGRIFAGVMGVRENKNSKEDGRGDDDTSNTGGDVGCNNDPVDEPNGKRRKRKDRNGSIYPQEPVPVPIEVIAGYDKLIKIPIFVSNLVTRFCDEFGFFLGNEKVAPGLAIRILTATKSCDKKACMDLLADGLKTSLSIAAQINKLKHSDLMQCAILQLVIRYECQQGMKLSEHLDRVEKQIGEKNWASIDFKGVWKLALNEISNPPTKQHSQSSPESEQTTDQSTASTSNAPSENQSFDGSVCGSLTAIEKMLSITASTFASGADKKDTMFLWMMVTMAERFCALYNIVSHPDRYYKQLEEEGCLSHRGGLDNFRRMCATLAPELEVYVQGTTRPLKVCINAVRGYETAVERRKNVTNNKVCKIKMEEMKLFHGLNGGRTKAIDRRDMSSVGPSVGCKTRLAFDNLFAPLKKDTEKFEQNIEETEGRENRRHGGLMDCNQEEVHSISLHDETDIDDEFFKSVNENRSFKFRTSLCHRQEHVSVPLVRMMEKELGRLLTLEHSVPLNNLNTLREIRKRNKRMRNWVIPYTMPITEIDSFMDMSVQISREGPCCCFQTYSGHCNGGEVPEVHASGSCIKLLVLPPTIHLKSLTEALKLNTMACERRYFSDVSTALGFIITPPPISSDTSVSEVKSNRWEAFRRDKCGGDFLFGVSTSGLYEQLILADIQTTEAFGPRLDARRKRARINAAVAAKENVSSNAHTGFFAGVWALCADHDLETTVLGSTITSPSRPTPLMELTDNETTNFNTFVKDAMGAQNYFARNPSIPFFECFEQMRECMARTNLTGCSNAKSDNKFYSDLVREYGGLEIPGIKMWTVFLTIAECFKNSLPLHWPSVVPEWSRRVLNLTEGVPNVDESGAVFEAAKFASVCARKFFCHCLNHTLGVETWERLLGERNWIGNLAKAYEKAAEENDIRVMESFIDSSTFLSNNNMSDKLKIDPTRDNDVKYGVWKERDRTSLRKRAEWMELTESGVADRLSFSFVLCAVSLLRITFEGICVKELSSGIAKGICSGDGEPVPLIRGLTIASSWCKTFVANTTVDHTLPCITQMRFADIEKDPFFYYRLAGYTIGLIAANDTVLESITRRILISFDFNGFDTSSWTQFIRYHFQAVLLGRRARLLSRPLAFIKRLVSLVCAPEGIDNGDGNTGQGDGQLAFKKRVQAIVSRLGKIILAKNVESENITANEILDCCLMKDEDVTADSVSSLYETTRAEFGMSELNYKYNLASNACSNAQLAKIKTAARILNCNVSLSDTSNSTVIIDADEEHLIDPSKSVAMTAGDAEVGRGGGKRKNEEDLEQQLPADKRQRFHQYRNGTRGDAVIYNNNSNSTSGFRRFRSGHGHNSTSITERMVNFDDTSMDEDVEVSEFELMSKNTALLKKAKAMLSQRDINLSVVQIIDKLKKFLTAQVPFHETDYAKLGVKPMALKAGIEAISLWNGIVDRVAATTMNECEYLQGIGGEYNMSVVTSDDYGCSKNKNCAFQGEVKFFRAAPTSFSDAFSRTGREDNFTWLNFQKEEKPSKLEDLHGQGGGRLMGYAIKDVLEYNNDSVGGLDGGGGTAEVRVLSEMFSMRIRDQYWLSVMPFASSEEGMAMNAPQKKKSTVSRDWHCKEEKNDRERLVSNLRINNKIKENKSINHCPRLMSLYRPGVDTRDLCGDENVKITDSPNDVFVTLGSDSNKRERYKCLYSLWHCNNGISPKHQIEIFKKLLFKNTNALWIFQYQRHISVLNTWGCLNINNVDDMHFSLRHGNTHTEVYDDCPPMSVFHSRYFDSSDCEFLMSSLLPFVELKKRLREAIEGEVTITDSELMTAVYSREIISSCLDPRGKFYTSYITNSASILYTPGTSKSIHFDQISSMDIGNEAHVDQDLVGGEKEISSRSFLAVEMEVIQAIKGGVFFQGERAKMGEAPGLRGGHVLRLVNRGDVCLVEPQNDNTMLAATTTATATRGAMGVFESASDSGNISETNDCALLNCQNARCLMMSHRAVLSGVPNKGHDGEVFPVNSMRYHAGFSKGYLLNDDSDLFSVNGRTNSSRGKRAENDMDLYSHCAHQFISQMQNVENESRVFLNDWGIIKYEVDFGHTNRKSLTNSITQNRAMGPTLPPHALRNISPHHEKRIRVHSTELCNGNGACFLANPCGPAKSLLKRAPNMRMCMTNAGLAMMSKIIAQTSRTKSEEDRIMDGSIITFKMASNGSCISVDSNRFFLIDGVYLIGGRVEDLNISTDMFTRCKIRSEKHVVYNSLFPPPVVSAFLATALEGTVHCQGLALLEHVSATKNNETSTRSNKNFWSRTAGTWAIGVTSPLIGESCSGGGRLSNRHSFQPALSQGTLKPPTVFMNDEDYVFVRMLYEVAMAAEKYATTSGADERYGEKERTTDRGTDLSMSSTTKAALLAARKSYIECVDQDTGNPRMHAIFFLRQLFDFGGFCTAICSGDGEKSHHLIYTLNSVSLNMAAKTIVMLVGPSGNNLKTTIVEVVKKAFFERYADVSVGVLNSSSDSSASTQANIAYLAGNKNILIVDEVGYQGSFSGKKQDSEKRDDRDNRLWADIGEVKAYHGLSQNTSAVWDQINMAMKDSKLKTCSRECEEVMAARSDVTPNIATVAPRKKRKRPTEHEHHSVDGADHWSRSMPLDRKPMIIRAFAHRAVWWNSMAGTVIHLFNEKRICYNLAGVGRFPFSVSNHHQSPWLRETDSVLSHCSTEFQDQGRRYTEDFIRQTLGCLFGSDFTAKTNVASGYASLLLRHGETTNCTATTMGNHDPDKQRAAAHWMERLKKNMNLSERAKRIYEDLVGAGSLLRWKEMKSVKHDGRPVLSCVPADKEFAELLSRDFERDTVTIVKTIGKHRLCQEPYDFSQVNSPPSYGVLYAFHAIHPRDRSVSRNTKERLTPPRTSPSTSGKGTIARDFLGPVLRGINRSAIENHFPRSRKLSSIFIRRGLETEVDEDNFINMEIEYDTELLDTMERPHTKGFPKFSTDGSSVMGTSNEDCQNIMNHIKRRIIDTGKTSNTGSFIKLCTEMNSLDPDHSTENGPSSSTTGSTLSNVVSFLFDPAVVSSKSNHNEYTAIALNAKCKKAVHSLCKFRSDGRTMVMSEIAGVASSKGDGSAISSNMLPGQFNSNTLKKITSKHASAAVRGVFCKPVVSSITMTPIMTSNSFLYMFFMDEALKKRMVTFSCDTQFAFSTHNEDVQTFIDVVDRGLKCVHSTLVLERHKKLMAMGKKSADRDLGISRAIASNWVDLWNDSVQRGMGTDDYIADLSSVALLLPARALQLLVKNSVLEHRDISSMSRLEESANTFLHMYAALSLTTKCERQGVVNDIDSMIMPDEWENCEQQQKSLRHREDERGEEEQVLKETQTLAEIERPSSSTMKPLTVAFTKKKRAKKTSSLKKRARPIQMCQINPKMLSTMAMTIAKCREGAWARINTAINCVMFVDAPFVETIGLYGEDMNLKMLLVSNQKTDAKYLDWCIGLRMPNPDMDVKGYDKEGAMIGAGAAISKQVCDAWGSMDVRTIMYSCHHLHMLFELVLQFSHPKCKLTGVNALRNKNKAGVDFVSTLFACLIYKEMMSKLHYPVFLTGRRYTSDCDDHQRPAKRTDDGSRPTTTMDDCSNSLGATASIAIQPSPLEIQLFLAMIINKPLSSLRVTSNLAALPDNKAKAKQHSDLIKLITNQLGQKLNPDYLCPHCRT